METMNAEPISALDRKLGELSARIARLERDKVLYDADVAAGRKALGDLLVIIGRRLRGDS